MIKIKIVKKVNCFKIINAINDQVLYDYFTTKKEAKNFINQFLKDQYILIK